VLHKPSLPEIDAVMSTEYLSTRFTDYAYARVKPHILSELTKFYK
jgi:hypothetical protein